MCADSALLELRVIFWLLVYSNTCWEQLHKAMSSGDPIQLPQGTLSVGVKS